MRDLAPDKTLAEDIALAGLAVVALTAVLLTVFAERSGPTRASSAAREPIGRVARELGDVRRRGEGTLTWTGATQGDAVYDADAFYVGHDSEATIHLLDGSEIGIDAASLVVVGAPRRQPPAVEVVHGGASGRAAGPMVLSVGGLSAELGAGAAADVRVGRDRSAEVAVREGHAQLAIRGGERLQLSEGYRQEVTPDGRVATAPEQLALRLVRPEPDARLMVRERPAPVSFAWEPISGVGSYLFELASDPELSVPLRRSSTSTTTVVEPGLAPGVYYWRVSRRTPGGRVASETRKLAAIDDRPPVPFRPRPGQIADFSAQPLAFAWGVVPDVQGYAFELARDEGFAEPVFTARVALPSMLLRPEEVGLAEGRYCYRVRADGAGREGSPWAAPVCFRAVTRPVLPAPELYDPERGDDAPEDSGAHEHGSILWRLVGSVAYASPPSHAAVLLRWQRLSGAKEYRVQVARDRDFASVLLDQRVSESYLRWQPPGRGLFFWRVRGMDAEGREGRVSSTRLLLVDPPAPQPTGPADGSSFDTGANAVPLRLEWSAVEGATGYSVEVGTDAELAAVVLSRSVPRPGLELRPPGPGRYFWRVRAIATTGEPGAASPVQSFTVLGAAPRLLSPRHGERLQAPGGLAEVRLRWSELPAARYAVELATDRGFGQVIERRSVESGETSVRLARTGVVYWRVRARDPEGRWSRPASFVVVQAEPAVPPASPSGESTASGVSRSAGEKVTGLVTTAAASKAPAGKTSGEAAASAVETGAAATNAPAAADRATVPELAATRLDGGGGENGHAGTPVRHTVLAGATLGLVYNLGEVVAVRPAIEIGYRARLGAGWAGALLRAGYYTDGIRFRDAATGIGVRSRLHAVPVELLGTFVLETRLVSLLASGGLTVTPCYATVAVDAQPRLVDAQTELGGLLALGVERGLGPGLLYVEAAFELSARGSGRVETDPGGLSLAVGYRLGVWSR